MDKNTLLVKTELGRHALAQRVPELGPRLRSMLIMVDGKRSLSELDKLGAGLGGGNALLEQLLAHAWVAERDMAAPFQASVPYVDSQVSLSTSPLEDAADPTASPVSNALSVAKARSLVARFVNDALGPMGEQAAIRVESCRTMAELQATLPRVREHLKSLRGQAAVQRFEQEIVPLVPRF